MHLALVSRFAWPSTGGTETLVRTLSASLSSDGITTQVFAHRIDDAGTQFLGLLDRGDPFPPQIDPVSGVTTTQLRLNAAESIVLRASQKVVHHSSPSFDRVHAMIAGRKFGAQMSGTTIVHRFGGNRMALPIIQAARRLGCPVVVTPLAHPGAFDDDPQSARAYRQADLVVATSEADADVYRGLGVAPDRVAICALPSQELGPGDGRRLRRTRAIDGPLVLFLGARRENKGIEQLLRAGDILVRELEDLRVAFVGPGAPFKDPPRHVLDVGVVDDQERNAWLRAADVVCLPSSGESFGLAVSEAWSAETPVVTSDIGVLKERVSASGGGISTSTVPATLAWALREMLTDPSRARALGRAGHSYWERNESVAGVTAWHRRTYERLLA